MIRVLRRIVLGSSGNQSEEEISSDDEYSQDEEDCEYVEEGTQTKESSIRGDNQKEHIRHPLKKSMSLEEVRESAQREIQERAIARANDLYIIKQQKKKLNPKRIAK